MDRCPVEVWQHIFTESCTDGGQTGCALSLVSHRIKALADPVRYHSVALLGSDSVVAFEKVVRRPTFQSAVAHLFMHPTDDSAEHALDDSIALILSKISESLKTLSIGYACWNLITAPSCAFSSLTDLSFGYPSWLTTPPNPLFDGPWARDAEETTSRNKSIIPIHFPSLRRLHVTYAGFDSQQLCKMIALSIPSLTHLRLSNIHYDQTIVPFLRILLDIPVPCASLQNNGRSLTAEDYRSVGSYSPGSAEAVAASHIASGFPSIRYICVQPYMVVWRGGCCEDDPGWQENIDMVENLETLAGEYATPGGMRRLVVLPEVLSYTVQRAHLDWLDVVGEGCGPWPRDATHYIDTHGVEERLIPHLCD